MQMFLHTDRSTISRDHHLPLAKAYALELAESYTTPAQATFEALGTPGYEAMANMLQHLVDKGIATPHDQVTGLGLARVLSGGDAAPGTSLTEQDYLDLEREVFISLTRTEGTQARIVHMLSTGRPLRN